MLGRDGARWAEIRRQVFTEETHCWVCHRWVDQTLDPRRHRYGRTVDHVISIKVAPWLALDRGNCRLAHRSCNSSRGGLLRRRRPTRPTLTVDARNI